MEKARSKEKERKERIKEKKKEESFPVLINSLVYDETMHPCVSEMKKKKKKKENGEKNEGQNEAIHRVN